MFRTATTRGKQREGECVCGVSWVELYSEILLYDELKQINCA